MKQAVTYVCHYCGTEHNEAWAACCHEVNHCQPRWAFVDRHDDELEQRLVVVEDAIHRLDWLDYQTRSDKEALAKLRAERHAIREELAMRSGAVA